MNKLKSIEEEWEGFAAAIFGKFKPSEVQRSEMKKAFFAGVWSLFCALEEIGMPHVSEEEGHAYLEARRAEVLQFVRSVMRDFVARN